MRDRLIRRVQHHATLLPAKKGDNTTTLGLGKKESGLNAPKDR